MDGISDYNYNTGDEDPSSQVIDIPIEINMEEIQINLQNDFLDPDNEFDTGYEDAQGNPIYARRVMIYANLCSKYGTGTSDGVMPDNFAAMAHTGKINIELWFIADWGSGTCPTGMCYMGDYFKKGNNVYPKGCYLIGDTNIDSGHNVLDVVGLVQAIMNTTPLCGDDHYNWDEEYYENCAHCSFDIIGDGGLNVLDVVAAVDLAIN